MSGHRLDAFEDVAAAGLRALPNWRGKASVALRWKRRRERSGPIDGAWRLRLSDGTLLRLPRGSQMAWSVAATGHWDRHVIALVAEYIQPRTIALDIGASVGLWTLPLAAAAHTASARLWCFEPNPDNLAWLRANLAANDLEAVAEVRAHALGARRGTARFAYREHGGGNGVLMDDAANDALEVPVERLDDIAFPHRVSFVKMDVEGFELEVLRGAHDLIQRDRPAIFGEFNAVWLRMREEDLAGELTRIAALGYEVFEVVEQRSAQWRPRDFAKLRRVDPQFASGAENLLLLPAEHAGGNDASACGPRPHRARRFPAREQRCGRSALLVAWRIGASLLRRRSTTHSVPVVKVGAARVRTDLRTALGLSLYRYGFCPPEARVLAKLLRSGDVLIDGGANIGLFAFIGAVAVGPNGRVLACEPSPGTMALLRANAEQNRFTALELHEVALADRPGTAPFTVFEAGSGLASFSPEDGGGSQIDVAVTTLDALAQGTDGGVAVVKLDIEGAEAKALRGAAGLIARDAPIFLIELEPEHLARQGSSVEDVRDVLLPHGYGAYGVTPRATLVKLTADWRPPNAQAPNVILAPSSRAARLAPLMDGVQGA